MGKSRQQISTESFFELIRIAIAAGRSRDMSTVKLYRIRIPGDGNEDRFFGKPALHTEAGILYIPEPGEGRILKLDTETDKFLDPNLKEGKITWMYINQERDMVFAVSTEERRIAVFKTADEQSRLSMSLDFFPTAIAYDGERDTIVVTGRKNSGEGKDEIIRVLRFPEGAEIESLDLPGVPRFIMYDDLEDTFRVLLSDPGSLVAFNPAKGRGIKETISLAAEEGNSFDVCLAVDTIVVGTQSGKILSCKPGQAQPGTAAKFKEPVEKVCYNPLMNHLYVIFSNSRNLAVIDVDSFKARELIRCGSEVSDIIFDERHNKVYAILPRISAIEVYLDQGK